MQNIRLSHYHFIILKFDMDFGGEKRAKLKYPIEIFTHSLKIDNYTRFYKLNGNCCTKIIHSKIKAVRGKPFNVFNRRTHKNKKLTQFKVQILLRNVKKDWF